MVVSLIGWYVATQLITGRYSKDVAYPTMVIPILTSIVSTTGKPYATARMANVLFYFGSSLTFNAYFLFLKGVLALFIKIAFCA